MTERTIVAAVADIPPGTRRIVTVRGREIGVFNLGGEFYALSNHCPHQGGKLCLGRQVGLATATQPGHIQYRREGEFLKCPWHNWEFDIRTGRSVCDPDDVRARPYRAAVAPGSSVVHGPFTAETFAVSVEEEYVVVEV